MPGGRPRTMSTVSYGTRATCADWSARSASASTAPGRRSIPSRSRYARATSSGRRSTASPPAEGAEEAGRQPGQPKERAAEDVAHVVDAPTCPQGGGMAPWSHAIDGVVTHVRRHCADFVTHGRREADTRQTRVRHAWRPRSCGSAALTELTKTSPAPTHGTAMPAAQERATRRSAPTPTGLYPAHTKGGEAEATPQERR